MRSPRVQFTKSMIAIRMIIKRVKHFRDFGRTVREEQAGTADEENESSAAFMEVSSGEGSGDKK